ncbi:3-hydroxyacyl-CoA dehydrogenase [Hyaloraphidium curvatum]|nr:3-hydroxyacyl-CoA dehydrogenase [Hyaloraphidium curvatum]
MAASAPDLSRFKQVGVIGSGQMGVGIAYVTAAVAKREVLLLDTNAAQVEKGLQFIDSLVKKEIGKGRMTEAEGAEVKSRVRGTSSMSDFSSAELIIEAATENPQLKHTIFQSLDQVAPPTAILASNTSSISITKIASATKRPESVIGMHFMNPVPVMKLVEIISGTATSAQTTAETQALAQAMGKTCTHSADYPGFIANRILMPYINEACFALMEGVGTKEDIDTTMKLGTNVPMGPLTLADFIGLDTCLAILRVLHDGFGDPKYRPCPLLVNLVQAGYLGKKVGRGFYEYEKK